MYDLPEPPATTGQADRNTLINQRADQLLAAINAAVEREKQPPTSVRVEDPAIPSFKDGPRVGDTPHVDQPGRPSMSPGATDASVMMIAGGFLSVCLGAAISGVLYFSHGANETVVITLCAAPPAAFLSFGALVKKVKKAAVPDVHNHVHNAPEYHETRIDQRKAVIQKNIDK